MVKNNDISQRYVIIFLCKLLLFVLSINSKKKMVARHHLFIRFR